MSDEYDHTDTEMPAAAPATILPRAAEVDHPPEEAVDAPQAADEAEQDYPVQIMPDGTVQPLAVEHLEHLTPGDGVALTSAPHPEGSAIAEEFAEDVARMVDAGHDPNVQAEREAYYLPQLPPIESEDHWMPVSDPHWDPIKKWVKREIWLAERGFSLQAREKNNP